MEQNTMNDTDKKILQLLQTNADIPISELSKKINLSPSPCWLRISKLYKQGYIKKKIAVIDRQKVNLSTVAFVQIKTSQHNMAWAKKFDEFYKKLTNKIDLSDVTTSFAMEEIKQTSALPLNYI